MKNEQKRFFVVSALMCTVLTLLVIACSTDDGNGASNGTKKYAKEICGEWIRIDSGERWYITQYNITVGSSILNRTVTLHKTANQVIKVTDSGRVYYLFASQLPGISFKARVMFIGGDGAGTYPKIKVTNIRQKWETVVTPDAQGVITIIDQIPGDTVEISPQGSEWSNVKLNVTPWVDGQDMGIIPLPLNAQGVNLKASIRLTSAGNIAELYADETSKNYVIDIENIGKKDCVGASYEITWDDADFTITGNTKATLDTITPGGRRNIPLTIASKTITEEFKVKDIKVTIISFDDVALKTVRWEDTVSVFYYRKNIGSEQEQDMATFRINSEKPIQGVIRTPRNVTYYFKTAGNGTAYSIDLPRFNDDYIIVFLGASVEANNETRYLLTVNRNLLPNWTSLTGEAMFTDRSFNESLDTAHTLYFGSINSFMYYLYTGAVQYYKVNLGINPANMVVSFNSNGGNDIATQDIVPGNKATRPAEPVKDGFVFGSWFTDPTLTTLYDFNAPVNASITLYAKWYVDVEIIPQMVWIEGGTFRMGNQVWGSLKEVSSFYIGKYEVTQKEYKEVMGTNPSNLTFLRDDGPVNNLRWYDALVFCNKKSIMEGFSPVYSIDGSTDPDDWGNVPLSDNAKWDAVQMLPDANGYRLPTEAEWEYACRAGTTTEYYTGDTISDDTGWYTLNSDGRTHKVGLKPPNDWGLYDMHGNVEEFCWDLYESTTLRISRGGCYIAPAYWLCSAESYRSAPSSKSNIFGIRLARSFTE